METTTFQGEDEDVDLQEDPVLLFVFFLYFIWVVFNVHGTRPFPFLYL